jgi:hypothetical protein
MVQLQMSEGVVTIEPEVFASAREEIEMVNPKVCPVLTGSGSRKVCIGEDCAWYVYLERKCAVRDAVDQLSNVQISIENAERT